ncbi:MAG: hypothetical protein RMY16_15235 [Nostoc sp. DedQUE12b]|uniref:hypothetical protein n=1 Tax=Nostoc sp. DedQUE12b TaxID=3075398 RepID=UPI002AD450B5|nr:hypothetical protein [Nostoc sp. DedQUE12b]MDZ8086891.1 hypothetical protein [Nostoc sp. DedQUE12b]
MAARTHTEKKGNVKGAIASYNVAYKTLESLRGDLVAINSDADESLCTPKLREFPSP